MKVTVRQVAKEAGVSTATVSRYFTGNSIVSTEAARQIEAAAAKLGYTRDERRRYSNGAIAVLVPNLKVRFFEEVLEEIMNQVPKYNFRVVFIPLFDGSEDYKKFFSETNFDGVIFFDEMMDENIYRYIISKNIRMVLLGGISYDQGSTFIHVNDLMAGYEGAKYLLQLGHRKILVISDKPAKVNSVFQRGIGVKQAFEEIGCSMPDEYMKFYGITFEAAERATEEALENHLDFSAIFAFSDEAAAGAVVALHQHGIRVPEDVSVLGFDDLAIARKFIPAITTIHQPIDQFVKRALDTFVYSPREGRAQEIVLPYQIIERESCAAVSKE